MKLVLPIGAAVFAAASLALRHKHHKDNVHLHLARAHSQLLGETLADEALSNITNSREFADLSSTTRAQYMSANRWVSLWSVMWRFGYLSEAGMREAAKSFMGNSVNRDFWRIAGPHRWKTARDGSDRSFYERMDSAHSSVPAAEPATL
ncbi:DUF6082 family protein [Streptomyces sp. NPDC090303]|uniref:DUF6082 family protein n=1 Tax=Streptomyces sp. NPDC090303 TaxID=3365960 RepID=UPI003800E657